MRKLGRKTFASLPWYWLFPSSKVTSGERWHATEDHLAVALKKAAAAAGITKRVTLHTVRHSNATALLQRGVDIRTIQEHLGHTHVETTEIYTHATGSHAVVSPLDAPPIIQPAHVPAPSIIPFPKTA
jgi:site-specific recombinase XerD